MNNLIKRLKNVKITKLITEQYKKILLLPYESTLCLILLIITVILFYLHLRKYCNTRVNCWFCNKNSSVPYDERNSWTCPCCEQYNGFDDKDDYNRVIVEQHVEPTRGATYCQEPSYRRATPDLLCLTCNLKQKQKVLARSEFEAVNEKTSLKEFEQYNELIEKRFPLCTECQVKVNSHLSHQERNFVREHKLYQKSKKTKLDEKYKLGNFISLLYFLLLCVASAGLLFSHEIVYLTSSLEYTTYYLNIYAVFFLGYIYSSKLHNRKLTRCCILFFIFAYTYIALCYNKHLVYDEEEYFYVKLATVTMVTINGIFLEFRSVSSKSKKRKSNINISTRKPQIIGLDAHNSLFPPANHDDLDTLSLHNLSLKDDMMPAKSPIRSPRLVFKKSSAKKIKSENSIDQSIRNQPVPFKDITWSLQSNNSETFQPLVRSRHARSPGRTSGGSVIDLRTDSGIGCNTTISRDNRSIREGSCLSLQEEEVIHYMHSLHKMFIGIIVMFTFIIAFMLYTVIKDYSK